MEKTSKIKIGWLVTAMVVVLLVIDQIIKVYIKTHFCLGESVRVTDWFYIEFVENNGMAWGMSFIGKFWLSLLRLMSYLLNGSLSGVDSMVHSSILYSILQIPVYQSVSFLSCFSVEKNWKLSEVVIRRRRLKILLLLKLLKKR